VGGRGGEGAGSWESEEGAGSWEGQRWGCQGVYSGCIGWIHAPLLSLVAPLTPPNFLMKFHHSSIFF
jgi:hypothetical protein